MSLSNRFKSTEKNFLSFLSKYFGFVFKNIAKIFRSIKLSSQTKFTVMLIPHSEKKVINFKISALQLIAILVINISVIIALGTTTTLYKFYSQNSRENKLQLSMIEQHNRNYHQAIDEFNKPYRTFKSTLNDVLKSQLPPEMLKNSRTDGDYKNIDIIEETKKGETPLTSILKDATVNFEIYTNALIEKSDKETKVAELLKDIPAKWPVGHNQGYITAYFGPAPHPLKRIWYLHKGLDIAYTRGTPVIATANGKVVEQQFNDAYGNYIIIRHKYGFYTKYAHLDTTYVKEGSIVTQGQKLGALGNTGYSSGPHLHYEIRINSQAIDPYSYVKLLRNK